MPLTGRQATLIRESWARVDQKSNGMIFYNMLIKAHPKYHSQYRSKMLERHPELKDRMDDLGSAMKEEEEYLAQQALLTFSAIGRALSLLEDGDKLASTLHGLGKRHINYGVQKEDFENVEPIVVEALNAGIGPMDEELTEAWKTGMKLICHNLASGQEEP